MRVVLTLMVRLVGCTAIVLVAVAISLGRHDPGRHGRRCSEVPRSHPISYPMFLDRDFDPLVLDTETGAIDRLEVPGDDHIEAATTSPWRDELGRNHIAGLWRGHGEGGVRAMGLARYVIPGGEVLDRIAVDVIPRSPPCWFPDTTPRILYAGCNGRLYQLAFERPRPHEGRRVWRAFRRPRPLDWHPALPRPSEVEVTDPFWSTDPRMRSRILASVCMLRPRPLLRPGSETRLWWLKISADGTTVEDLSPLRRRTTEDPSGEVVAERFARVATTPDGGLALAFLVREAGSIKLQLRLARLLFDAQGVPFLDPTTVVTLADDRPPIPPVFSPDGRWLFSIPHAAQAPEWADRFPVAESLARAGGSEAGTGSNQASLD